MGSMSLIYIAGVTLGISLIALVGVLFLALKEETANRIVFVLVALASGTLLGGAFIHLIPESMELSGAMTPYAVLTGILLYFATEKFLMWHHCHKGRCEVHPFSYLLLLGDAVHNFIDGVIIAANFLVSIPLGFTVSLGVAAHEVPQNIGNFGVLLRGGFSVRRALLYNYAAALMVVLGALVTYFVGTSTQSVVPFLIPFAAGGFVYIAATDLFPELHKETSPKKSLLQFFFIGIGILFMAGLKWMG
jgi:zinc and cadmium transporter